MRDLVLLAIHLLVTLAKFLRLGGVRAVAAKSLSLKHELLICNRSRQRAPNLTTLDRLVLELTTLFMRPHRIPRLSVMIKPATLLKFHKTLVDGKYCRLFSSSGRQRKPGPKGPSAQLIAAIVEMQQRNPRCGCVRIAQQISYTFGLDIDKDIVRRVLAKYYLPDDSGCNGPSWSTFIAQARDSLWSIDLFRFHRWLANLRVLEIDEIKTVPNGPVSHPFVERLIGTIRREYLDRMLFLNAVDLERKLQAFGVHCNRSRVH